MTPVISATTYYIVGKNALETYGANTQRILAFAKPVGGGSTVLIGSTNGGTSWTIRTTGFDGDYVRFLPEAWGGDGSKAIVSGADGIAYTSDFGDTLNSLDGDFASDVASFPALGAFEIGG